jgi:hypothetical protein
MNIKKLSFRTVIPALLTLMAILPLSSCGNNILPQSTPGSDSAKTATSKNSDRFLFVQKGKFGYIDRTGKIVIPAKFDRTDENFSPNPAKESMQGKSDGLIAFDRDRKVGYKDRTGKIVVPAKFDILGFDRGGFNDGLAPVCLNEKCGYIDKTGKIVVPLQFDLVADRFSDGLAWVNVGKKLGYINKTGKLVIPARYRKADIGKGVCNDSRPCINGTKFVNAYPDFDRGLAVVAIPECKQAGKKNCRRTGYIDTTGKLVFEF